MNILIQQYRLFNDSDILIDYIVNHQTMVYDKIDNLNSQDIVWKRKSLFTTITNGIDIQTAKTGLIGITLSVIKRILEATKRDYTDTFGKSLMNWS